MISAREAKEKTEKIVDRVSDRLETQIKEAIDEGKFFTYYFFDNIQLEPMKEKLTHLGYRVEGPDEDTGYVFISWKY